jgi:hypothetical protein
LKGLAVFVAIAVEFGAAGWLLGALIIQLERNLS